jgi:hypothetical protein
VKKLILCLPLLAGCAALGDETVIDPETGQTAGEANQETLSTSVGGIVGAASGNPAIGFGVSTLLAAVLAATLGKKRTVA